MMPRASTAPSVVLPLAAAQSMSASNTSLLSQVFDTPPLLFQSAQESQQQLACIPIQFTDPSRNLPSVGRSSRVSRGSRAEQIPVYDTALYQARFAALCTGTLSKSQMEHTGKCYLEDLCDAMGIHYKRSRPGGRGGDTKPLLYEKLLLWVSALSIINAYQCSCPSDERKQQSGIKTATTCTRQINYGRSS